MESSVIILAAGFSVRAGQPKLGLPLSNGETFLQHLASFYAAAGCEEIIAVINAIGMQWLKDYPVPLPEKIKLVINPHPEKGRFGSIQCGCQALEHDLPFFIHNIDNPTINAELTQQLLDALKDYDFVKPVYRGKGGHPVLLQPYMKNKIVQVADAGLPFYAFLANYSGSTIESEYSAVLENLNNPCRV
ncbi:MAG: NTP transferase domain-containing protein [Bacteroidales bacterium]|nr:NTP transferase domain-containing protein [Bacteroidales bacterium]MDD3527749.1 NTP transferase domain-containing protein [Bacteroidales bacterium]NLO52437.1 NTP transferase domain-containing protein [Bacteroidales bacterium]